MPPPIRLRVQLLLGGIGALTWYAGLAADSEFVSGLGVGVLIAAVAARFLVRDET